MSASTPVPTDGGTTTALAPVPVGTTRRAQLVAAARHLLETEGADAVTVRRIGAALGMRGPSIYKHVPDKASIEAALVVEGLTEQAGALDGVPRTFADIARAYRAWALAHPHLHRLLNSRPLDRDTLPPGLEDRAAAPLIDACGGDRTLARAAWGTVNGLVDLELAHRFPPGTDLEPVYAAAARAFTAANRSR